LSDLKVDGIIASTGTNTALTLQGKGSGKVAIGDGALLFPDADGSDGEFIKTDGSKALSFAAAGGGAWNIIGTAVASTSSSLTITGLSSTYDTYAIAVQDVVPATDSVYGRLRFGDSGGVDSGGSDYSYSNFDMGHSGSAVQTNYVSTGADHIRLNNDNIGNQAGEGLGGMYFLHRPGDGTTHPSITGQSVQIDDTTRVRGSLQYGKRDAVITLTQVYFDVSSGNIATGRLTVWGIAHA
jgi:hypothetical protein